MKLQILTFSLVLGLMVFGAGVMARGTDNNVAQPSINSHVSNLGTSDPHNAGKYGPIGKNEKLVLRERPIRM